MGIIPILANNKPELRSKTASNSTGSSGERCWMSLLAHAPLESKYDPAGHDVQEEPPAARATRMMAGPESVQLAGCFTLQTDGHRP